MTDTKADDDILIEVLRRYNKKGRLVLSKRVVIDGRVFEPAIYTLTHAGPAPKDDGPHK
jgi:hypothetical protein